MKDIQQCAILYRSLLQKTYYYTLEEDTKFDFYFTSRSFYHLTGLHKLVDLTYLGEKPEIAYKHVLSGRITQSDIERSVHYSSIEDRLEYFYLLPDMLNDRLTKIVIDFDRSLVNGSSKLRNTRYILYKKADDVYVNFTLAKKGNQIFPETFFAEPSKKYISGQTLLDIQSIKVIQHKSR